MNRSFRLDQRRVDRLAHAILIGVGRYSDNFGKRLCKRGVRLHGPRAWRIPNWADFGYFLSEARFSVTKI